MSKGIENEGEELLTAEQVGARLNVSGRLVLYWEEYGIVPSAVRVKKVVRFRLSEVLAGLERSRTKRNVVVGREGLVALAMWLLKPDIVSMPTWLIDREPSSGEEKLAATIAATHWKNLRVLKTQEEAKSYCEAAIAAAHVIEQDPEPDPEPDPEQGE